MVRRHGWPNRLHTCSRDFKQQSDISRFFHKQSHTYKDTDRDRGVVITWSLCKMWMITSVTYFPYSDKRNQEVLGRTNSLLSFRTTWLPLKPTPPIIFRFHGHVFTESLPSNDMGIHRHTRPENLLLLCVFFASGTRLPSRYLATILGYTYTHRLMGGIYEVLCWDGLRCHSVRTKPSGIQMLLVLRSQVSHNSTVVCWNPVNYLTYLHNFY
jgi:hypothetical protein